MGLRDYRERARKTTSSAVCVGEITFRESIIASSPRQRHAAGIKTLFAGRARRCRRRVLVVVGVFCRLRCSDVVYLGGHRRPRAQSSRVVDAMRCPTTIALWRLTPSSSRAWEYGCNRHCRRQSITTRDLYAPSNNGQHCSSISFFEVIKLSRPHLA